MITAADFAAKKVPDVPSTVSLVINPRETPVAHSQQVVEVAKVVPSAPCKAFLAPIEQNVTPHIEMHTSDPVVTRPIQTAPASIVKHIPVKENDISRLSD